MEKAYSCFAVEFDLPGLGTIDEPRTLAGVFLRRYPACTDRSGFLWPNSSFVWGIGQLLFHRYWLEDMDFRGCVPNRSAGHTIKEIIPTSTSDIYCARVSYCRLRRWPVFGLFSSPI